VAVGQFVPVECTKPLNMNKPVKHYPHSIKKALAQKKILVVLPGCRTSLHCNWSSLQKNISKIQNIGFQLWS